jgi:hypothetical protein
MNALLINALVYIVGRLIDGGLFETIKEVVSLYSTNSEMSGEEKKAAVQAALKKLKGDQKAVLLSSQGYLINLAIEAAVAWVKSRGK